MANAALVATAAPDGAGLRSRRGTGREKLSAGQSAMRLPCPPHPVHPVVVTAGHQQQILRTAGRAHRPPMQRILTVDASCRRVQIHRKHAGFNLGFLLALRPRIVCIVSVARLCSSVHQPDPPGLIHDDPRLLPPWRGSSFLGGH
jgi:hypothetical protein